MKNKAAGEGGLIKTILLIVIAILVVSYFGINIRALVTSPTTQDNVSYVTTSAVSLWNNYLKGPVTYLWNEVFLSLIWNTAMNNLRNGSLGQPSMTSSSTPGLSMPPLVQ